MLFNEDLLQQKIKDSIAYFNEELKSLKVGRLSIEIFNDITIDYYGMQTPLVSVAKIAFDGSSIVIRPHDKNNIKAISKSIEEANLGASVNELGDHIRLSFPPMTKETRLEKVKELGKLTEERRINIRNIRKDFMEIVKKVDKVPEDEKKNSEARVQKLIDEAIANVESISAAKETELLNI